MHIMQSIPVTHRVSMTSGLIRALEQWHRRPSEKWEQTACISDSTHRCLTVWMDGWMDGCMHACMHVCMQVAIAISKALAGGRVTAVLGLSSGTCGGSGSRALSSDFLAKPKMRKISGASPPIRRPAWLLPCCPPSSFFAPFLPLSSTVSVAMLSGWANQLIVQRQCLFQSWGCLSAYLIPKKHLWTSWIMGMSKKNTSRCTARSCLKNE